MSNNGSQHLSALTRDEITAPHVNLVPSELPGDLYKYVADHVWKFVDEEASKLSLNEYRKLETVIANLKDMKTQISQAPLKSDRRKALIADIIAYKKVYGDEITRAAVVFWHKIIDGKHRRKVVKRGVMTLPYGGTPYGLGEQVIDDSKKHGIESLMTLEHKWGSYMGRLIFEDCRHSLQRPMRLLSVFEAAGKAAEKRGEFLAWNSPITHFPVVQAYMEGKVKKVYVQHGPPEGERLSTGYYSNTLQLNICFIEDTKPSKGKQATGAAPNAIHSLDAAHLMLIVDRADFSVTTIHDSFGCLLCDMPKLFVIVRETFVELYENDPLTYLMTQIGGDINNVEIGSLDVSLVLDSEYCFA